MKNMNMVRNFLLAGAVAWASAAQAAETVAWIDGGLDTSWPANATGGTWYCQNVSSLKWTESSIPGIPKKVAGVTLDNWAYVGLKYTATEPLNLGFGGGVTETRISTQVLLQPVLREDLPKVDSDDKGGVILVLEDDGTLRYYVVAQEDETNGTGANVWKLAGSVPRVTDETVPSTIVIRIHQDGPRWLVDYTIDGTAEAQHVIAVGLAPTVSSVRYTGPCTVQALSASCVRYPAWLKTDDPSEVTKYDAWARKYGVTDSATALQWAYLLDCANTQEAVSAAKASAGTTWFDGGVDAQWPNHTTGGQWKDVGTQTWSASAQGVTLAATSTALTFAAGESLALDSSAGDAGATVSTRVTFVPHTQLPSVESDDVAGILLLREGNAYRYYIVAQQDESAGSGANVWKPASDLPVLQAAPTASDRVSVRVCRKDGRCQVDYTVDGASESAHIVAVDEAPTLGRVSYTGTGTLAYLAATQGVVTNAPAIPEPARFNITISAPQNGTLETSVTNNVLSGATVTVTATPTEGYELASVTVNGTAIAGNTFTMPEANVMVAATFTATATDPVDPVDPPVTPTEPTQMFYLGEQGYDSWAGVMSAAKAGDTITVGKDASFSAGATDKSVTIDLCGRSLSITGGWWPIAVTVVDSDKPNGSLKFSAGSLNVSGGTIDFSALNGSQVSGTYWIGNNAKTTVKFPGDMELSACTSKLGGAPNGMTIVVKGIAYVKEDGSWTAQGGSAKTYPEWIDATDKTSTAKYDDWAAAKGVTDTTTALQDAYLLNCANTEAAVVSAKALFGITSITVNADGTASVTTTKGTYNGAVEIHGCEIVNGTYHAKTSGDRFFKAVLK